jgi:hypothetical protein
MEDLVATLKKYSPVSQTGENPSIPETMLVWVPVPILSKLKN